MTPRSIRARIGDGRLVAGVAGVLLVGGAAGWMWGTAIPGPAATATATPVATIGEPMPSASPPDPSSTPVLTPSALPVGTPEPTVSPTPAPTPTPRPSGAAMLSWQRAVGAEGTAFRIKWLGSRWMAVGTDAGDAATWTSTDGLTWTAGAPILPAASEDPQALSSFWINDVIELDTGYLAVGWNSLGGGDGGRAATWTSPDGVEWTHHDPAGTPFGETYHGPFRIARLASGEVLLLSWTGLGTGAMLWISDDGRTWSELPTRWDDMYAVGLAEGSDGVMLIGLTWSDSVPTALISTDARTWTPVVAPPGAKEVRDVSYDEVGGRFVVGGVDESDRPTVYLSTDGRNWATTRLDDRAGHVSGVSTHGGLIALSGQIGLVEDAEAMVWASHDGITWSINEMGPGSASPLGVAPDGVVLWVRWWEDSSEQQTLWLGTVR